MQSYAPIGVFFVVLAIVVGAYWALVVTCLMLLAAVGWDPLAHADANKP